MLLKRVEYSENVAENINKFLENMPELLTDIMDKIDRAEEALKASRKNLYFSRRDRDYVQVVYEMKNTLNSYFKLAHAINSKPANSKEKFELVDSWVKTSHNIKIIFENNRFYECFGYRETISITTLSQLGIK